MYFLSLAPRRVLEPWKPSAGLLRGLALPFRLDAELLRVFLEEL